MLRITLLILVTAALGGCFSSVSPPLTHPIYDVTLLNGRLIDPESGFDQIANLAIRDGKIAAISESPLSAKVIIDVQGSIVSPGFIDLHSHAMSPFGQQLQVQDGVTTALELEAGAYPLADFTPLLEGQAIINYGASVGHLAIRQRIFDGVIQPHISMPRQFLDDAQKSQAANQAFKKAANEKQLGMLKAHILDGIAQGGLGIGLLLDYISGAVTDDELELLFATSADYNLPVFVHIRRGLPGDPEGLTEVINMASAHNTSVHICHLNASAMKGVDHYLALIRQARAQGVDITTEAYPYNAGSTAISAAVFNKDWKAIFDISYEDIEWAETGMRFNQELWHEYREKYPTGQIIHHYGREEWTRAALLDPLVLVASDAMPVNDANSKVHPRGIGTFSRVLARYTHSEMQSDNLSLINALKKMTVLPAQRLETFASSFANKGRLRVGFDADITIFDATQINDQATFTHPIVPSKGVKHVLVGGVFVLKDGQLTNNTPGKLIVSDVALAH
jgi:predicted amidohydrolase